MHLCRRAGHRGGRAGWRARVLAAAPLFRRGRPAAAERGRDAGAHAGRLAAEGLDAVGDRRAAQVDQPHALHVEPRARAHRLEGEGGQAAAADRRAGHAAGHRQRGDRAHGGGVVRRPVRAAAQALRRVARAAAAAGGARRAAPLGRGGPHPAERAEGRGARPPAAPVPGARARVHRRPPRARLPTHPEPPAPARRTCRRSSSTTPSSASSSGCRPRAACPSSRRCCATARAPASAGR